MTLSYNPDRDKVHNTDSIVVPLIYGWDAEKQEYLQIRNDESPERRNQRRKYLYVPISIALIGVIVLLLI